MTPTGSRAQQVAITGMGAITPCGLDVAALWESVVAGRSAIGLLEGAEFASLPVRIGGRIRGFDANRFMSRAIARRISPVQQWAMAAGDEAMRQAGIDLPPSESASADPCAGKPALPWPRERFAVIAATGSGPVDAMQAATRALDAHGPRAVPPTLATYGAADAAASLLAERYGAFGASEAVCATCASGAIGLGTALRWIRHGYAEAVLVVGMEDCLGAVNLASNARMRALAAGYEDHPADACRPFDRGRSGFVMSAGACAMLLESEAALHAGRGDGVVVPLAELAGFGVSSDAWHATAPRSDGAGAALAISTCLTDAGVDTGEVDHVNAHGTGTPLGDAAEIRALQAVFGERGRRIPISATKSTTGHLLGAAGVAEAIIAVRTLQTGLLPPTRNLTDPEFGDWSIVAGRARSAQIGTVLSNSFGFGGHNAALLLRRWSEGNS